MKEYIITVNGVPYEVTVEEKAAGGKRRSAAAAPAVQKSREVPAAKPEESAPASAPQPSAAPSPAPADDGSAENVAAPMPGKVLRVLKHEGETVEAGETVLVLEAMKMENEIQSPVAGTIVYTAAEGEAVEMGSTLVKIK